MRITKRLPKETTLTKIGFILAIISVVFGIISIVFIGINISAIRNQNDYAISSERNERFKNSIDQLGSESNAIVLGGIYTLHRIAKEDESYRENVFNILCSYVRDVTTTDSYQKKYKRKPSEPIQTILNILSKNENDFQIYRQLLQIDFSGAYLVGTDLQRANLTYAILYKANLTGAILYKANLTSSYLTLGNFTSANLENANLTDANLENANLTDANLMSANLTKANLKNADFTDANLGGANLFYTDLMNSNFTDAYLEYANLTYAYLLLANFTSAYLENANLRGANLFYTDFTDAYLENANLKGVYSSLGMDFTKSFEEVIKSRIGESSDLSGINGYDPKNPPFEGIPIFGAYTEKEAKKIIEGYQKTLRIE